ncbi:MAG TPA: SAF domain-containing protein [Acidimicrobiales bacterium]|nr:SAF domain-containing protein [Acidimicrobiales bacterium]
MADLGTAPAASPDLSNGSGPPRSARPLHRARSLPGGRAVVGGFLVAASAVGVFAAYTAASSGPDSSYVVVDVDVPAGERLAGDQLSLVPLELPDAQRRVAFTDLGLLDGATALSSMTAGQLVQSGDVAKPAGGPRRAQISLAVDPGNALGGDPNLLGDGDLVAVIATYTTGGTAETSTVSRDALVVRVLGGDDRVGGAGGLTVVLAVPPADLEPIARASAAGVVSLARTTGLEDGNEGGF